MALGVLARTEAGRGRDRFLENALEAMHFPLRLVALFAGAFECLGSLLKLGFQLVDAEDSNSPRLDSVAAALRGVEQLAPTTELSGLRLVFFYRSHETKHVGVTARSQESNG